jgi:hypothetical protein
LAAHWRFARSGLQLAARGSYSFISFTGERRFVAETGSEPVDRQIKGKWNGNLFSASANASQSLWSGSFFVRPSAGVEYYRLSEDGYRETGGGEALDLTVAKRKSSEFAVTGALVAGVELGARDPNEGYLRLEAELGRRQVVGGSLGKTRAHFEDGEEFVLTPEDRASGWLGRLRGVGGDQGFQIAGEVGAEEREDKVGLTARASISLGF